MRPLYQFAAGDSFIHRLDPRTKLIFVILYMVSAFIYPYPWWMFVAVIILMWVGAGIKPSDYAVFLVYMLPLMFTLTLIQMLIGGTPGINIFGLEIPFLSLAGWWTGIRI